MMRGLKGASRGWIHASWIDVRKEEHPRQLSRSVLPAKRRGKEVLLGWVEFQIKATALWPQVSPVWCSVRVTFGWDCCAFLPGKDTNLPLAAAVCWGGGWLFECLVLTWWMGWWVVPERFPLWVMAIWAISQYDRMCVCEHVYGFPFFHVLFFFFLNSSEMLNKNKWKDSALKMDLSQQPATTTSSLLILTPSSLHLCRLDERVYLFSSHAMGSREVWGRFKRKVVREEKGMMGMQEEKVILMRRKNV